MPDLAEDAKEKNLIDSILNGNERKVYRVEISIGHATKIIEVADDVGGMRVVIDECLCLLAHGKMVYFGNSPYWWAVDGGYTPYFNKARIFTLAEARKIKESTRGTHNFMIYHYERAKSAVQSIVDVQYLPNNAVIN